MPYTFRGCHTYFLRNDPSTYLDPSTFQGTELYILRKCLDPECFTYGLPQYS